ncbi:hypothetical protein HZA55_09700 [Candidatus Poribacteria bacterium]|nr:hypothetical protein [Candidatus Poribacteria bacterium]
MLNNIRFFTDKIVDMKIKKCIILLLIFLSGCAGAHYQSLPSAPLIEKGEQRIGMNFSFSFGQERKLKWYIPRKWWISNWGYSLEYRFGIGKETDVGIYPAGFNILPCAVDVRWIDKKRINDLRFHRMEFFYNPITFNSQIANAGVRYDYFLKETKPDENNIIKLRGTSFILSKFWDVDKNGKSNGNGGYHPIIGVFYGEESENVLYEVDYLPGFNYFMEKPAAVNPIINFSKEKDSILDFLTGDLFLGFSHGNIYKEK